MGENRQLEFAALRKKAKECLERPDVHLPHHNSLLRLWHYPSFAPCASWHLYSPVPRYEEVESSIVVRSTWDQVFDAQRFMDPMKGLKHGFAIEPSMSLRQTEVSREQLEPRFAALREIALPILVDDGVGVDGESFGIETFGFKSSVSLTWWNEPSVEWSALSAWCRDFRCFFDECLERRTSSTQTN